MAEIRNDYINLFKELGISTLSTDELIEQRKQAMVQQGIASLQQEGESFRGERDLRQGGGALGVAIGQAISKPKLTEAEKKDEAIRAAATAVVKDRKANDAEFRVQVEDNPGYLQVAHLQALANAYMDANDLEKASAFADMANKKMLDLDKAIQAKKKAGLDFDLAEHNLLVARDEHARKLNEKTSVVIANEDGTYDLEGVENGENIQKGKWDPERKKFVTLDGQELDNFLTLDEAIRLRNLQAEFLEEAGKGSIQDLDVDTRWRLFNAALPATERTGIRAQMDALATQDKIMNRIADMFLESIEDGQKPGDFLDGAGKITAFVTDVKDTVSALGNTWMVQIASGNSDQLRDGTGEVIATVDPNDKRFRESYGSLIDQIQLPEAYKTGDRAAEYQSAIIQLAYAVARSNEPGARQLSDTDFRNALKELGAAAADPNRLRQVMLSNFSRKAETVNNSLERIGEIGQTFGLQKEDVLRAVAGDATRKRTLKKFGQTQERYDGLMDTLDAAERDQAIDAAGVGEAAVPQEDVVDYDYWNTPAEEQ